MATTLASLQSDYDDLQGTVDDAVEVLQDAYTSEASREALATAIGKALDILAENDTDDDDSDDDDGDDDQD